MTNREDGYQTGQLHQTQQMGVVNLDTVDGTIALGHNRDNGYQRGQLRQIQQLEKLNLDTVDGTIVLGQIQRIVIRQDNYIRHSKWEC